MYMPRLCYGYVQEASLNKYKKTYIFLDVYAKVILWLCQKASLNKYKNKYIL